jgi:hypothetical protein
LQVLVQLRIASCDDDGEEADDVPTARLGEGSQQVDGRGRRQAGGVLVEALGGGGRRRALAAAEAAAETYEKLELAAGLEGGERLAPAAWPQMPSSATGAEIAAMLPLRSCDFYLYGGRW